ncbi:MAG TPA: pilus assembly protein PilO [Halothiobacillus sp.]|nr:pilus assembly protein PilO [Halothiobacillus sp.]
MDVINELKNLDFKTIGSASLPAKLIVFAFVLVAIIGAGIYLGIKPLKEELQRAEATEPNLKREVEQKQRLAANLEAYQQQLAEIEVRFGELLRQLPNRREAENLIVDVAQTSLANGLRNRQIQPGTEVRHEFYAEIPYTLRLEGPYHALAKFVSDTASLPRIVTLHNPEITLGPGENAMQRAEQLQMTIVTKTYRYLEEGEKPQ